MIEVSDLEAWALINSADVVTSLINDLTEQQYKDLMDVVNLSLDLKYNLKPFNDMKAVYMHNFEDVDATRELILECFADFLNSINFTLKNK